MANEKVLEMELASEQVRGDGLGQWHRMVIDEIDLNYEVYGLTVEEKDKVLGSDYTVDSLVVRMQMYMQHGNRTEHDAIEMAFQNDFGELVEDFRLDEVFNALAFDHAYASSSLLAFGQQSSGEVKIFHDGVGSLFCRFRGENFDRPLRDRIQDIKEGDAFLRNNQGYVCIAGENARQNFDMPDACWVVHDRNGEGYFEEDIGKELGTKIRNLMKSLKPREVQGRLEDQIRDAEGKIKNDNELPFIVEKETVER